MQIKCTECGLTEGSKPFCYRPDEVASKKEEKRLLRWLNDHVINNHFHIAAQYQKNRKIKYLTSQDIYVRFGEMR